MTRKIISFHALFKHGLRYSFDDMNGLILAYKNVVLMFKSLPCNHVYETMIFVE